jgi:signal transduction histidine kinase
MGEERALRSGPGADAENERLMERLLDATSALAHTLGAETLDPIARATVTQAQRLVEARTVLLLLEERRHLVVAGAIGEVAPTAAAMREPADGAAWRRVMGERRPERVSEVGGRLAAALEGSGIDAQSGLLVPLVVRERSIGVIACFDRIGLPGFTNADEDILTGFAASAAMAVAPMQSIAEARLRESIEVAERERARWARELHDETLQGLGALRVRLAASLRQGRPEKVDAAVREAVAQIEDEIANLRSLITELRPAALDELGLGAAIESLAENHAAATELDVHLDLALAHEDGVAPKRLERDLESAIYRVIQEALTNVAKHADADGVWIEVAEDSDSLLIVVRDDGSGFDMNDRGRGFGLVGIRERIALQGGSLAIVSSPGAGTEVRGRIPLHAEVEGDGYSGSSMPRSSA